MALSGMGKPKSSRPTRSARERRPGQIQTSRPRKRRRVIRSLPKRSGRGRRKRIGKAARINETIVDPPGDRGDDDALAGNGLDGSRRSIMLERCDRTIGQKKLVVLTVSDHGRDLVHQEFARLLIIVDLSRTLEIVPSDLNRVFQQERGSFTKTTGHDSSFTAHKANAGHSREFLSRVRGRCGGWSRERSLLQHVAPFERPSWRIWQMTTDEREFGNLIGSDKVEGTAVFGAGDRKIGSIERVMIDKISGRVSYAVLGFGGFLGLGNEHYPLPWQSLKYDTDLGGYRTGVTEDQLRGAPMARRQIGIGVMLLATARSTPITACRSLETFR